jgi:hypothetical protein
VRVIRTLDEAVEEDGHLVHLLNTASHYVYKLFYSVFKEEQFDLLGISVEYLVRNHLKSFNHQGKQVVRIGSPDAVSRAFACDGGVHIFEALAEEANEIREVKHAAA